MQSILDILEDRISAVMAEIAGVENCPAIVKLSTDPKFGDYQVNGVMPLAKQLKTNPRQLAEKVVARLDISGMCEEPEVAGPGFINLRIKPAFLAQRLLEINSDTKRLGIKKTQRAKNIVVDFSGPNIAKQMHVGHLRSTILGDCICRILNFLGHNVTPQNHIGDWGLQMGMLLFAVQEISADQDHTSVSMNLNTLEAHYKNVSQRINNDPLAAEAAHQWTVKLHNGDTIAQVFWRKARATTLNECYRMYKRLGVNLDDSNTCGESEYKDELPDVVEELKQKNLAVESDGAVCVFPDGFKNKEGEPLPFIIQKSDGAYLYATTDLAALRYRMKDKDIEAEKVIYVTDARQKLHFEMLFAVARKADWVGDNVELSHVMFGSVQGPDSRPLKTRSGENVKLKDLLGEAVERAKAVVEEKNPELGKEEKDRIAEAVGIGAVKYADYSNNRTSDYIFSFDKMLAMEGNTAPYMQYAYARIKSIERKAQSREVDIRTELGAVKELNLSDVAEVELAKHLCRYIEAIETAASDYRPNYLTSYLYELAQKFSVFYTNCPVLKADPEKRPTRLMLCDLTARTIRHGLTELLGIKVVEQM